MKTLTLFTFTIMFLLSCSPNNEQERVDYCLKENNNILNECNKNLYNITSQKNISYNNFLKSYFYHYSNANYCLLEQISQKSKISFNQIEQFYNALFLTYHTIYTDNNTICQNGCGWGNSTQTPIVVQESLKDLLLFFCLKNDAHYKREFQPTDIEILQKKIPLQAKKNLNPEAYPRFLKNLEYCINFYQNLEYKLKDIMLYDFLIFTSDELKRISKTNTTEND